MKSELAARARPVRLPADVAAHLLGRQRTAAVNAGRRQRRGDGRLLALARTPAAFARGSC